MNDYNFVEMDPNMLIKEIDTWKKRALYSNELVETLEARIAELEDLLATKEWRNEKIDNLLHKLSNRDKLLLQALEYFDLAEEQYPFLAIKEWVRDVNQLLGKK